ncbi:hypothetical protein ppKF707_3624 [Metapseudomonas furukawaii]|uniref:Uncharacterized protein n=1 Tax=Metapseudomonas furukawaii TaxID=1149133 RepID=A0AAD1BWU1_METFU|nr:hypothetical protein ppKF707_3624 [Pseudomonas furukawaii]BAU72602.1 hypothetical protein KF707C_9140 [Pseudomonas furukawaii]
MNLRRDSICECLSVKILLLSLQILYISRKSLRIIIFREKPDKNREKSYKKHKLM